MSATAPDEEGPAILCANLVRIYQHGDIEVQALQGLDLVVGQGEMVALVGASGSGKSTLLNILSGLDVPTAGTARVAGWDLLDMPARRRLAYRRRVVGFVWQQTARNLLPFLSAAENVELPMAFAGVPGRVRRERSAELLDSVGMGARTGNRPNELSGGEQQRVAIAVALAGDPRVLLADEPTGELDAATGREVMTVLRDQVRLRGTTVLVVTHDQEVASSAPRTIAIRDGKTSTETVRTTRLDHEGTATVDSREYALLDRAGRVQIPAAYRRELGIRTRVSLDLQLDHIAVRSGEGGRHRGGESDAGEGGRS